MREDFGFSSEINSQISFYEKCLLEAKKVAYIPIPDGFDDGDQVATIERVLTELNRLRDAHRH